jgi:cysteine desulfurase
MEKMLVYADNAGTTRMSKTALDAMMPYLIDNFGNPSAVYSVGREAKAALEGAREKTARALGAEPGEIYFTGCGTEADNWALTSAAEYLSKKGKHIISSAIEHHAITHTLEHLEKQGLEVTLLPVDEYGQISPEQLREAIREDTILVSIMTANTR